MSIVITVLHVVACFVLIVVVLLQTGKGADIGAVFGGSSQTIFGSSGAGNLLTRLTTWTAVVFMATSLLLTYASTQGLTTSIADTLPDEPPPLAAPLEGDAMPAIPAAPAAEDGATAPPATGDAASGDAAPAAEGAAQAPAVEPAASAEGAPVEAAPAEAPKPADDKSAAADPPAAAPAEPAAPTAP
jgi:preprotein translocase subunit SecG